MWKNAFSLFILCLCSCQYQFGSSNHLKGNFFVDAIENNTTYRLADTTLRTAMINSIKREKGAHLSTKSNADLQFKITITNITRVDKEIDPLTGAINESQFFVTIHFQTISSQETKAYILKNTDYKNSSGIYRTDGSSNAANDALKQSLTDVAEAVLNKISGSW